MHHAALPKKAGDLMAAEMENATIGHQGST
jgi:hypothetical protein